MLPRENVSGELSRTSCPFLPLVVRFETARHQNWSTKHGTLGHTGIDVGVKYLLCLKRMGSGASLRERGDGEKMGKETIRACIHRWLDDVKEIYGATYHNRRPTRADLGAIEIGYANVGFPGCIGAVDGTNVVLKSCPHGYK